MVSLKNAIHAWAAHNVVRSVANSREDPSCTKAIPSDITIGQPQNISITSSDVHRSYLIVVPPLYTSQSLTPVIFSFHGGHRNASQQLALDQMTNPEFNNFAITIYPQGVKVTRSPRSKLGHRLIKLGEMGRQPWKHSK